MNERTLPVNDIELDELWFRLQAVSYSLKGFWVGKYITENPDTEIDTEAKEQDYLYGLCLQLEKICGELREIYDKAEDKKMAVSKILKNGSGIENK